MTHRMKPPRARAALILPCMVLSLLAGSAASAQIASPDTSTTLPAPAEIPSWLSQPQGAPLDRWSLAKCIATALDKNIDARAAHAQTERARGASLGAWSGILPSLSGNLGASRVIPDKRSSFRGFTQDSTLFGDNVPRETFATRTEYLQAGATLGANIISVPSWKEKNRQDHLKRGAEEGEAETRNGVVFAVKQQYFTLLKAQRLADVSRESERLARDQEKRAEALFQVGTVARGDVLKARARRATTQLDRIRAENQVEIQRSKLKQILGQKPETPLEIEGILLEKVVVPDSLTAVQKALKDRPELSRVLAVEDAARAGLTGARARRLPSVSASLNVDRTKIDEKVEFGGSSIDTTTSRYTTQWQGQVRLNLPFFDGFALEGNTKQAKGAVLEAEAARRQREVDVKVEVQQAWLTLRESLDRIGVARDGLASAEEDYKFSKGRYDLGAGTYLDVLQSEVSLSDARRSYVEALADAHVAEAALERAIGERRY